MLWADNCYAVIRQPEYDSPTYNLRDIFVRSMDWDYHCADRLHLYTVVEEGGEVG